MSKPKAQPEPGTLGRHFNDDEPNERAVEAVVAALNWAAEKDGFPFAFQHYDLAGVARLALHKAIRAQGVSTYERVQVQLEDAERKVRQYRGSAAASWVDKDRLAMRVIEALTVHVADLEQRQALAAACGVILPADPA